MKKSKGGRRPKPPAESRTELIQIRVTRAEKAEARRLAAEDDRSVSDWFCRQAFGRRLA